MHFALHENHFTLIDPMKKGILLSIAVCFAFSFAVAVAQEAAQDPFQDRTTAADEERLVIELREKDRPVTKGLKLEREFRPRLPNGFAPLVNPAQREEIYEILTEYNDVIALLELRVELLKNERDVKVDAVLTPAQQQRLNRPVRALLPRVLGR